jgi:iron complex outermembrane receptor protein
MESIEYQVAQILNEFPDVSRAQFFLNAVDTTTQGVDVVATYGIQAGSGSLNLTASGNLTKTEVTDTHVPQGVITRFNADSENVVLDTVFNCEERNRLEDALPRHKGALGATYRLGKVSLSGRANYYGSVEYKVARDPNDPAQNCYTPVERDEHFDGKIVFDADAGYQVGKWRLSLGAINLFNTFPDKQQHDSNISGNRFIYSRRVSQFGINGGFYYLRLQYMH